MIEVLKKIMIVDDEAIQRNGLYKVIQQVAPNSTIVACSNGQLAWDNISLDPPQLLLTDIKMPVMDGMQLIQKVSEEYPQIKIVLISAYQEFDFAQTAIRCQVTDYLIKPYRKKTVEDLLERMDTQILSESKKEQQLVRFQQYSSEMEKQKQERQLRGLLFGSESGDDLQEYEDFSTIFSLRFRCIQLSSSPLPIQPTHRQKSLMLKKVVSLFPQSKILTLSIPLQPDSEKMIMFTTVRNDEEACQALNQLAIHLRQENILMWAGVSQITARVVRNSKAAYQQAEDMLAFGFYHQDGSIYCYEQQSQLLQTPAFSTAAFEKQIAAAWRGLDNVALHQALEQYRVVLQKDPKIYPRKVKHRVTSVVMNLIREIQGLVSHEEYDELLNEAYAKYGSCESLIELFAITEHLLMNTNGFFQFNQEKYDAVEASIQYVKTHLEEDLSLQKVARQMHFHPNYLSGKIKNKLGMSYTAFLVRQRMQLASELLRQTDLQVQTVAKKCGFNDSSYFNRVFRKEHGISPEQYRKVNKHVV